MGVREVAYRLKVDGKSETRRAFQEVGADGSAAGKAVAQSFNDAGQAAESAAQRGIAASERQMAAWTAQALKAKEIQTQMARNAMFDSVLGVGNIRKSAEESAAVFEQAFNNGLTRMQKTSRLNLTRQAADIFTMAGMGASPSMIGISQGPQIIDAWQTAGIKLNAELMRTIAIVGMIGGAVGALGIAIKIAWDAWEKHIESQRKAVVITEQLADISQRMTNATAASIPVLQAEARALEQAADAAYRKAAADRDRALAAQLSVSGGDTVGAGLWQGKQLRDLQGVVDEAGKKMFDRSVERTRINLNTLGAQARDIQAQISSGVDREGNKLSKSAVAALNTNLSGVLARGRSEMQRLQTAQDAALKANNITVAKQYSGLRDIAESVVRDARAKAITPDRGAAAAARRAERAEIKEAKENERDRIEMGRRQNALYDIRLGLSLKLAQITGEGVDIIQREINFRQIVASLMAQGVIEETARAEAAKQVRLEAEAEMRVRRQTPDGFVSNADLMKRLAPKIANLTTGDPLRPYLDQAGDYFADSLRSGMMAAANDDSFFDTFRDRLKNSIVSAFADRAAQGATNLLFGAKGGGGSGGLIGLGLAALKGVGKNAEGTDNWRGGLSWVGEKGPELLNIPRGAQIISNAKSKAMMGGPPVVINNNIDARGAGPNEVARIEARMDQMQRDLPAQIVATTNDGIARGSINTSRG